MKVKRYERREFESKLRYREIHEFYQCVFDISFEDFKNSAYQFSHCAVGYDKGSIVAAMFFDIRPVVTLKGRVTSIYFGFTAINGSYRNKGFVQKVVIQSMTLASIQNPFRKKYIWCYAATYKPYLFYSKLLKIGFPKYDVVASDHDLMIRDALIKNGPVQVGQDGWISTIPFKWNLKDESNNISDEDLLDPHIKFYNDLKLPSGIGLCSYSPANWSNLFYYISHEFKKFSGLRK